MRIIVWTVVGLIVVAAVVFFVVIQGQEAKVRNAGMPTVAEIKQDAERIGKRAEEYLAEFKNLESGLQKAGRLTEPLKGQLADAQARIGQIRDRAKALAGQTGKAAEETKRSITELVQSLGDIRRALEKAAQ